MQATVHKVGEMSQPCVTFYFLGAHFFKYEANYNVFSDSKQPPTMVNKNTNKG